MNYESCAAPFQQILAKIWRVWKSLCLSYDGKEVFEKCGATLFSNIHLILERSPVRRLGSLDFPRQILDLSLQLRLQSKHVNKLIWHMAMHIPTHLLVLEQILSRAGLHVVGIGIGVLQRIATLGEQRSRIEQILPVDPGAAAVHDLRIDALPQTIDRLLLQFERLGMILPALVVMQILFECLARLHVHRFVGNIGIVLVAGAFIIFGAVRLPIAQAHPAEVVLTIEALHMIAAAVLLDAYVTLGAVFGVCAYIVGRFAVVGALGQPFPDDLAVSGRMVVHAALETEARMTDLADGTLSGDL